MRKVRVTFDVEVDNPDLAHATDQEICDVVSNDVQMFLDIDYTDGEIHTEVIKEEKI